MCELFTYICVFHSPVNARELFDKYKTNFYVPTVNEVIGEQFALKIINDILSVNGYSLTNFNLPSLDITIDNYNDNVVNHFNKASQNINERINSFTNAQSIIFNTILNAVNGKENKCFFIDGPGGSGKSYILNTLIAYFKDNKINLLPVAWTGTAANLLEDGKTVHTAFKLT